MYTVPFHWENHLEIVLNETRFWNENSDASKSNLPDCKPLVLEVGIPEVPCVCLEPGVKMRMKTVKHAETKWMASTKLQVDLF